MFYKDEESWQRLPGWAEFFIELGGAIAREPQEGFRTVIALSLPTRAFSAGMVAAGIVKENASRRGVKSADQHFEYLCNLPEGTFVQCLEGKRQKTFILRGCTEIGGETRLIIQMSNPRDGNARRYVSKKLCHEIQVLQQPAADPAGTPNVTGRAALAAAAEVPKRQKGKQIHGVNPFAREFLQDETESSFLLESSLDCLLVGRGSYLREELLETSFCLSPAGAKQTPGNLQDVLRVRQMFATEQPSRCEFVPADLRRKSLERYLPVTAPIVIFDGAGAFLKLRDHCRRSHWVVLLDRAENNFAAAIEQVNQDFIQRVPSADEPEYNLGEIPVGVELMIFQEKTR